MMGESKLVMAKICFQETEPDPDSFSHAID